MYREKHIIVFLVAVLLVLITGCRHTEDKPLWQQLDEAQYNRYKPRLDHMIEKYGEEFTMDNYGTVSPWNIQIGISMLNIWNKRAVS